MKPLGGERYRIGSIIVDRKARQMTIPARVHVVDRPLEYLLTARGGMKEYESLLETDATGTESNLACILLGLERDKAQEPYLQFSQKRVSGPRVDIVVARKDGERKSSVAAGDVLFDTGQKAAEPVEWVYTGSQEALAGRPVRRRRDGNDHRLRSRPSEHHRTSRRPRHRRLRFHTGK